VKPAGSNGNDRGFAKGLRDAAPLLGLGMTLAVTVLAGLGGGYWLDGRLQTRPWFLLLGGSLGLAAGLYHFLKTVAAQQPKR
jgi:F0F1-type ATP synthase assembly protein I